MAYLRLAVTLRDDVALDRVINVPKRQLGPVAAGRLKELAKAKVWQGPGTKGTPLAGRSGLGWDGTCQGASKVSGKGIPRLCCAQGLQARGAIRGVLVPCDFRACLCC
jgi:hypothetical protein